MWFAKSSGEAVLLVVKSTGFGVRQSRFKRWLCCFLAMWPWTPYTTFLWFSFFSSKIIVSQVIERLNESVHLNYMFKIPCPQFWNPKSCKNQKFSQKFAADYLVANPDSRLSWFHLMGSRDVSDRSYFTGSWVRFLYFFNKDWRKLDSWPIASQPFFFGFMLL